MNGDRTPKQRPRIILPAAVALVLLLGFAGWMIFRRAPTVAPLSPRPSRADAARTGSDGAPALPPVAWRRGPAPHELEYMSDGVPIMPPGPDDPHPNTFAHPHPITPQHKRIFRENALLFQLNEAMDGNEAPRLRGLLKQYSDEYPDDPHDMQKGYALIADCIERPSADTRAAARRYYDEEIASTLRRFVMRHCLEDATAR